MARTLPCHFATKYIYCIDYQKLTKKEFFVMILDSKHTPVAYRCPHCGAGVISAVNVFSLSADMVKLKCTCGKSEMTIVSSQDEKIRLTVPCMLCATPHIFTVNSSLFYGKDIFSLS